MYYRVDDSISIVFLEMNIVKHFTKIISNEMKEVHEHLEEAEWQ